MKRFQSPLTKVIKLRTQEKRLSQLVLARRQTEHAAMQAQLDNAELQVRHTSSLIDHSLGRSFGAAELQAVLQGLEQQGRQVEQIRAQCAKSADSVATALQDLHEKMRREQAVEHLLQVQRKAHRQEGILEQQNALDDHSSRLWYQSRLKEEEVG